MNKTEFINAVAAKGEMDKKAAEKAVNAVIAATTDAEKQARNPRTGETMTVPASKVPAFKAGKALKDAVK